tara:strand:+ start:159 stop:1244 length:1086 start_codon:yes stop_codon:yes gene_type:complete
MNKIINVFLIILLVVSGCKKEDDPVVNNNNNSSSTTIAQDKQNISNTFSSMESCITTLKNGYGATALKNFLNLDQGEVLAEDWIEDMLDNIDDLLDLDAIDDDNRFDYFGNTGTYTWIQSSQSWNKNSNTNKIIINFPATEWDQSNDAVFTFHSYSDISLFYDGENIFAPTSVVADLYVDGTKVFDINGIYSYDMGNATPIPININTTLTFTPYIISISALRITSKEFEADITITDNSGCIITLHADVRISHDDYENLDETDIVEVNTIFVHDNMKIEGYMDGSLLSYDDPSNTQINAMTDVELFYTNSKIGELIFQTNSNNDDKVNVVYMDGSSEDVETYYDPFVTNIEQILFPFMGDWD